MVAPGTFAVATAGDREALLSVPGVVDVVDDLMLSTMDDPVQGQQWALLNTGDPSQSAGLAGVAGADANVVPAWGTATGAGVVVAVVDTGVSTSHPDLAGQRWVNAAETCDNGVDDNRDALVDCVDPQCVDAPACAFETCDNGRDDDNNGQTDCADFACANDPACIEDCRDGVDNNGNALIDCLDPSCARAVPCQSTWPFPASVARTQDGDTPPPQARDAATASEGHAANTITPHHRRDRPTPDLPPARSTPPARRQTLPARAR